ncbi:hypothetical protein EC988_008131, partial [Linderina pennispora]
HQDVAMLRDSMMCDVADDFLVSDVFDESPVVYAAMRGLEILEVPNAESTPAPPTAGRQKRKRYTLTPADITNHIAGRSDSPDISKHPRFDGINGHGLAAPHSPEHTPSMAGPDLQSTTDVHDDNLYVGERRDRPNGASVLRSRFDSSPELWSNIDIIHHAPAISHSSSNPFSPEAGGPKVNGPEHEPEAAPSEDTAAATYAPTDKEASPVREILATELPPVPTQDLRAEEVGIGGIGSPPLFTRRPAKRKSGWDPSSSPDLNGLAASVRQEQLSPFVLDTSESVATAKGSASYSQEPPTKRGRIDAEDPEEAPIEKEPDMADEAEPEA